MNDSLKHYGVLGMRWGHHKIGDTAQSVSSRVEKTAYALGAKAAPREFKYKVRKATNRTTDTTKLLADYTEMTARHTGVLPTNKKALKAVESMGIKAHAEKKYDNLDDDDIRNLKTYTDSARYSRSVNSFLAINDPKAYAREAEKLKKTLSKNSIEDLVVYRSCAMQFSINGVAKKHDGLSDEEFQSNFSKLSKNFNGKSLKENRVFSTSTSPLFAIDTWREVNPTAASSYNTYMIIHCKGTPGVLADGKTSSGKALVNTRSNQEAILAPNKLTYKKLEFDNERKMFAITVEAS